MDQMYELVLIEYELPNEISASFDGVELLLDVFVPKKLCAYDIHTKEPILKRKERRMMDQLVRSELIQLREQLTDSSVRPLVALDQLLQSLENQVRLCLSASKGIEFGSIGVLGEFQTGQDESTYDRHSQLMIRQISSLVLDDD